jgi:hypothetical protein
VLDYILLVYLINGSERNGDVLPKKSKIIIFSILIYVQQDAKLHNLFYLETTLYVLDGTTTQNI